MRAASVWPPRAVIGDVQPTVNVVDPPGENIYAAGGQARGQDAVNAWASEGANYNYANNSCSGGTCGHYTQVVWRDTLEIGCALGSCPGLQFPNSIVCDYGPGGNSGGLPY